MVHTEVDIPTHIYEDIERFAKANRRPTAQVLREVIGLGTTNLRRSKSRRGLARLTEPGVRSLPRDLSTHLDDYLYDVSSESPFLTLAKFGMHGPKDLASNADDYLYGDASS
jgi:hypothetical protein